MVPNTRALIAGGLILGLGVAGFAFVTRDGRETGESLLQASAPGAEGDAGHMTRIGLPETDPAATEAANGTLTLSDLTVGTDGAPRVIDWDDLVPAEGMGEPVSFDGSTDERTGMPDREAFGDVTEADIEAFIQDIDDMRSLQEPGAAIRTDLDGVTIRMAGYVTPVGFDAEAVTEFLLVPFLGACIHVPPPPANQIVYATEATGLDIASMWEPVWITGTLRATPVATVLADVGYRIEGAEVEPYL
ncbi:MAG: DUF3299 domain-containing protein [Pseudomonadota bacterium]